MSPVASSRIFARRGFTLLELLIATAVGAVVLIVVQTTFFGALRLHNTTHRRIEEDAVVQRCVGIVRRDLAGLMLPGGTLAGELQTTTFSSSMTEVAGERITPDLYTNSGKIDGWNPFSEVQMVAYYLAPAAGSGSGNNLIRAVTRNLLPVQDAVPEEQIVLEGVESASILFYDGNAWIDFWDSSETSTLPSAVKFSIVLTRRGGGQTDLAPIDLVVPILATTTTSQTLAEEEAML
jgi:type II secretion system protein J